MDEIPVTVDILSILSQALCKARQKLSLPEDILLKAPLGVSASLEYGLSETFPYMTMILTLYHLVLGDSLDHDPQIGAENALLFMVENDLDTAWLVNVPWSITLPIWEAVRICRNKPSSNWPVQAYDIIDRMDMAAQQDLGFKSIVMDPTMPHILPVSHEDGVPSMNSI